MIIEKTHVAALAPPQGPQRCGNCAAILSRAHSPLAPRIYYPLGARVGVIILTAAEAFSSYEIRELRATTPPDCLS